MLEQTTLNGLDCVLTGELQSPRAIAVICHGFGAPGTDLVGVGEHLFHLDPELASKVLLVFPAAPLDMANQGLPGGRAWWMIDMLKLQTAIQQGDFRDLRREVPPGLDEAHEMLNGLIGELQKQHELDLNRFILGGFSQGSMLACDVTFQLPTSPGGLCIWSGTLLAEERWKAHIGNRQELPVYQSHGTLDPVLPYQAALWLRELMNDSNLNVTFNSFEGMHTIPSEGITGLRDLVKNVLDSQTT